MVAPSDTREAVVLLSGGVDSTVLTWWAKGHYDAVRCIALDYGQDHRIELSHAKRIAALGGVPLDVVRIDGLPIARRDHARNMFIRGRNSIALGLAALSVGSGSADILFGSLATDFYPDANPEFMADMTRGFAGPETVGEVRVLAPLHRFAGKEEVALLGYRLGAPLHLTWSCMTPNRRRACGSCSPCRSRDQALASLDATVVAEDGPIAPWLARNGTPFDPTLTAPPEEYRALVSELLAWAGPIPWRRGWRYRGPDESLRFSASNHPTKGTRRRHGASGEDRYLRVAAPSELGMDPPWELTVLADGSVTVASGGGDSIAAALARLLVG